MPQLNSEPESNGLNDQKIAELLKQGNHDVWEGIVKKYRPFLENLLRKSSEFRTLHDDDLQDIIQDVFLSIYCMGRRGNPYNSNVPFQALLVTYARYRGRSFREKFGSKNTTRQINTEEQTEDISNRLEKEEIIQQLLQELSSLEKMVIQEYIYNGKRLVDIAQELEVPEGTVRSTKKRALNKLRRLLGKYPGTEPG